MTKKTLGRQKIDIKMIENKARLQVTFSKRRSGLFKKASELSVLTGSNVAIMVLSPSGKVLKFGTPDFDSVFGCLAGRELEAEETRMSESNWWDYTAESMDLSELEGFADALQNLSLTVMNKADEIAKSRSSLLVEECVIEQKSGVNVVESGSNLVGLEEEGDWLAEAFEKLDDKLLDRADEIDQLTSDALIPYGVVEHESNVVDVDNYSVFQMENCDFRLNRADEIAQLSSNLLVPDGVVEQKLNGGVVDNVSNLAQFQTENSDNLESVRFEEDELRFLRKVFNVDSDDHADSAAQIFPSCSKFEHDEEIEAMINEYTMMPENDLSSIF